MGTLRYSQLSMIVWPLKMPAAPPLSIPPLTLMCAFHLLHLFKMYIHRRQYQPLEPIRMYGDGTAWICIYRVYSKEVDNRLLPLYFQRHQLKRWESTPQKARKKKHTKREGVRIYSMQKDAVTRTLGQWFSGPWCTKTPTTIMYLKH